MAWDESKHPRDDDGKFARYNSMSIDELKREAMVNIGLNYFSNRTPPKFDPDEVRRKVPRNALDFARLHTKHHERHVIEMGFNDPDDYKNAAMEFWNSQRGILYYNPYSQRYHRYEEKSRWHVTVDSEGVIHTFMPFKTAKGFERIKQQEALYEL